MTPAEVQDAISAMADMGTVERALALSDLAAALRGRMTKADIKASLSEVMQRRQADRMATEGVDVIRDMNEKYFVMKAESKVRIGSLDMREVNGHAVQSMNMMTRADFGTLMANRLIAGEPASEVWLVHPEREEFEGFFTHPDKPKRHNDKLNLWQGFSVEPKKGPIKGFRDHVMGLVDGDREQADYVMKWIAWGFQNPHLPIGTVIVWIGEQGTGKGMLGNTIRSLWGGHGIRIGNQNDLVGKHNAHLLSACYAFVDEALFAGNKQVADVLKGLVTEPTLRVEPKFQDSYEVDNMLKMMCASNHNHAMQVEFSDRRYAIFGVPSSMKKKPREYWKGFYDQWAMNKEGKAALLYHFLNMDVSEFDPERDRPFTSFYLEQKMASLADDWLWWRQVAERETWQLGRGVFHDKMDALKDNKGNVEVLKSGLYDAYCHWHAETQRGSPIDERLFWRSARKWLLEEGDFVRRGKMGDQVRKVLLPSFEVIYQRLEDFLRG